MRALWAAVLALIMAAPTAAQDLRGHGGPVRALSYDAVSGTLASGGMDGRAVLWKDGAPLLITRGHDGPVTAVAAMGQALVSGGHDGRVAVWIGSATEPQRIAARHDGPVGALLALGPMVVSGGWDGEIRLSGPEGAEPIEKAHKGRILGLAALKLGFASLGDEGEIKIWGAAKDPSLLALEAPAVALAATSKAIFLAGADGTARRMTPEGKVEARREIVSKPLLSIAAEHDLVATGAANGDVWLLDAQDLAPLKRIQTGQGAIWAVAMSEREIFTGGADGVIRRWSRKGEPLGQGAPKEAAWDDGSAGARVWRACAVCHSLTPDQANKAGPSLHGLFGRKIATAPGYEYSPALKKLEIVWTPETLGKLFELGPEAYTPGSRMPEQRLTDPADRAALAAWLAKAAK